MYLGHRHYVNSVQLCLSFSTFLHRVYLARFLCMLRLDVRLPTTLLSFTYRLEATRRSGATHQRRGEP